MMRVPRKLQLRKILFYVLVAHCANSVSRLSHWIRSVAARDHPPRPASRQKRLSTSSNFIHLRRRGLRGRNDPRSAAVACHAESRHVVTLWTQAAGREFESLPAQRHFLRKCSATHSLTLDSRAKSRARAIALFSHSTRVSSPALLPPAIRRSMLF